MMPTFRPLWLLIVLVLSNVNVKSAPFLVGAFTISIPGSRFAIRTRGHVLFSTRAKGRPIITQEKIDSFRAGIEALELPPPPFSFTRTMAELTATLRRTLSFGTPLPGAPLFGAPAHDILAVGVPAPEEETKTLKEDLVVVASQINACEARVTAAQRELVHSFLSIAQLAARRHSDRATRSEVFWDVLLKNGWAQRGATENTTEMLAVNATMNDQIIPILTKAFAAIPGNAVAEAASKILNILKGLNAMAPPSSWIQLYHRRSERKYGADFQFSTTWITDDNTIELDLVNVEFNAGKAITKVLFFTFKTADAKLEITKRKLFITPFLLESLGTALREKVRPYVPSEILGVDHA